MDIRKTADRRRVGVLALSAAVAALVAGCGQFRQPDQVLDPSSFVAQTPPVGVNRSAGAGNPLQAPDPAMYNSVHVELMDQDQANDINADAVSPIIQQQVRSPSQAVAESVGAATQPAATQPQSPPPNTQPAVDVSGQYQVVGSVLAEVNGKPVYADQVLHALDKVLKAQARQYDAVHFQQHAADLIARQVHEYINGELEFAAAEHHLDQKDKDLAKADATVWRQQQIAQAGGSVEQAKRRAADEGLDFEDQVNQHYRLLMTQLYYQRHVLPLIRVSPRDMRQYYDAHKKDFTQYPSAQFRVIEIDVDSAGSVDAAYKRIEAIREKALAGSDFAQLATRYDDNPILQANAGYPVPGGWVDKGAYNVEQVESAVWKLDPGQLTTPIRVGDSFYLAKLEQKKNGAVQPFESEPVQDRIRETLHGLQFTELRSNTQLKLEHDAIINYNPHLMDVALDMVMQEYPYWVGKK